MKLIDWKDNKMEERKTKKLIDAVKRTKRVQIMQNSTDFGFKS